MSQRFSLVIPAYNGRAYVEGKKITWKDGLSALRCILKYNLLTVPQPAEAPCVERVGAGPISIEAYSKDLSDTDSGLEQRKAA